MKRYPAYKDSGVEWLGEVPSEWAIVSLKTILSRNDGGVWGEDPVDGEGVTVLRSTEQTEGGEWCIDDPAARQLTIAEAARYLLETGDLLITKSSGSAKHIGKTTLVNDEVAALACCYSNFMQRIRLLPNIVPRLVWYFLNNRLARLQFELLSNTTTGLANLTAGMIGAVQLPLPPLPEQRAIADFLDREVAKIDDLVAEQRRLIALLAEKRQAVISHAVTRGLNPDAPLKPSGIDWLGDIPQGWEVVRFSRLVSIAEGQVDPEQEPYTSMPLIAPNHIESGTGRLLKVETAAEQGAVSGKYLFEAGAVVYSKIRPALAKAVTAPVAGLCSADMYPLTSRGKLDHDFLKLSLLTPGFTAWATMESDRVAMPKINREKLNELMLPVPPIQEQHQIVVHVEAETSQIDVLCEVATSAITLLQERRAALISAAVTGKIDVREAVAPIATSRHSLGVSAMIAGVVIARYGRQPGHGRVWLQKMLFMAQTHENINEIDGHFLREPAGPLDRDLRDRVEADLTTAKAIRVTRVQGEREAYHYEFLGDVAQLRADLSAALGVRMDGFERLTDRLGDLNTKGIEAVATLYAAWNDFLIDGQTPSDSDITREVLDSWHPEKSEKFSADELDTWLAWMRRQDIVPSGTGQKTYTGRLFV